MKKELIVELTDKDLDAVSGGEGDATQEKDEPVKNPKPPKPPKPKPYMPR